MSKNESRVLDVFGPNLIIESNGSVGVAGPMVYQLYSVTDKGYKYQQALHGSGLASMDVDGTLEIQTGRKNKSGRVSYVAMAHHGDMCMTADNGWVRIKGQNIVLDASNEILIQGKKVTIGNANGTTETTEILGKSIIINGSQEVIVKKSSRITKQNGNIYLKSSVCEAFKGVPSPSVLIAAFIPGGKAVKLKALRPGER